MTKSIIDDHIPKGMSQSETQTGMQKIRYSLPKIHTGSDLSTRNIPLMVAESKNPGSVVWLTGCVHGDEVGGIIIIQEFFRKLRKNPLIKGSVRAFPLMNPIGFETTSRNITLSKEDLNRSFPGNKQGSLAERIAYKIFTMIVETNPVVVLDLHNDWRKSIPYTLIDPEPGLKHKDPYARTRAFSRKTGLLLVLESRDTNESTGWRRTLSGSLLLHNIPSLTLELGESYVVNEQYVQYGVKSIWNILSFLGMVKPMEEEFQYPLSKEFKGRFLNYSQQPVSSTSGIIRFLVSPGDKVTRDQSIAKIYNPFGKLLETLQAQNDGIVLGYSDTSVAFPGLPVMAFGTVPVSKPEPINEI